MDTKSYIKKTPSPYFQHKLSIFFVPMLTGITFSTMYAMLPYNSFGNTLLEGACIRLTWHVHNHDTCEEYEGGLCMFMTTVIKCHLLNYDIFNADDIVW